MQPRPPCRHVATSPNLVRLSKPAQISWRARRVTSGRAEATSTPSPDICPSDPWYSASPDIRTWHFGVRLLSYAQMWVQMWVLKPNQDSWGSYSQVLISGEALYRPVGRAHACRPCRHAPQSLQQHCAQHAWHACTGRSLEVMLHTSSDRMSEEVRSMTSRPSDR